MNRFPDGLPRPQRDDYQLTQVNNISRTGMESGRSVQRIDFEDVPTLLSMSFVFSHSEAALFDAWVKEVAKSDWFLFPVYSNLGYDDRVCRFTASPSPQTPVGVTHWRYICNMEIQEKPSFPPGWVEYAPQYILMSDIFDRAVNKELPEA